MSKKKPGAYPAWLYNFEECGAAEGRQLWLCSGCGAPYWLLSTGQPIRFVGPCWRSHHYGVECVTPKQDRYLYRADAGYTTEAPEQDVVVEDKFDHSVCISHFKHPAFRRRLCVMPGQREVDVRAFADEIGAATR